MELGKFDEAEVSLLTAKRLSPDSPFVKAALEELQKRREKAKRPP